MEKETFVSVILFRIAHFFCAQSVIECHMAISLNEVMKILPVIYCRMQLFTPLVLCKRKILGEMASQRVYLHLPQVLISKYVFNLTQAWSFMCGGSDLFALRCVSLSWYTVLPLCKRFFNSL